MGVVKKITPAVQARKKSRDWYETPGGDPRGYIKAHALKEVWFHTGTACNLACPFCLEGSKPGDTRLGLVKFEDVYPLIEEAMQLGVEQFSFTGGEPFVAKDFVKILKYASRLQPCMVLTNATKPLHQRIGELEDLVNCKHPINFRVSLDSPEELVHDLGRGQGSFKAALEGLKMLNDMGFGISIARHMQDGEDTKAVDEVYRDLFEAHGLPRDLNIVAFPDFATPGSMPDVPEVTKTCMTQFQNEKSRRDFMCAFSRMVVKKDGQMRVYACTLVDDDTDYDLGGTLLESLMPKVSMKHHRCYSCFKFGASCSEI